MANMATLWNSGRQVALGGLGIAVATSICFPLHVTLAIPAFVYLLIIVLGSPTGGFASSAIVSLVAVLCLDYFFTPPVLQLGVASPIDGWALGTYLVTSLMITRLASEARLKARSAERRQEALARLYEVAWRLFSIEPQSVSGTGTLQVYREVLDVEAICLHDAAAGRLEITARQAQAWRTRPGTPGKPAATTGTSHRAPGSSACASPGSASAPLGSKGWRTPSHWPTIRPYQILTVDLDLLYTPSFTLTVAPGW